MALLNITLRTLSDELAIVAGQVDMGIAELSLTLYEMTPVPLLYEMVMMPEALMFVIEGGVSNYNI